MKKLNFHPGRNYEQSLPTTSSPLRSVAMSQEEPPNEVFYAPHPVEIDLGWPTWVPRMEDGSTGKPTGRPPKAQLFKRKPRDPARAANASVLPQGPHRICSGFHKLQNADGESVQQSGAMEEDTSTGDVNIQNFDPFAEWRGNDPPNAIAASRPCARYAVSPRRRSWAFLLRRRSMSSTHRAIHSTMKNCILTRSSERHRPSTGKHHQSPLNQAQPLASRFQTSL